MKALSCCLFSSLQYNTCKTDKTDNLRILDNVTVAGFSHTVLRVAAAQIHRDRRPCFPLNVVPAQKQTEIVVTLRQIALYGVFAFG